METPNSKGRNGFWEAYQACTEENRVPPDRSPFYVNWAKTFTNFIPEKSLKERTGKDIEAFLADLAKRPGIADWQVRQAKQALRILYEKFLPDYAPEKHTRIASVDIRTVQELLGHANVITTMIYTHVLNKPGLSVKSPADI
jgi:hypothetical protein